MAVLVTEVEEEDMVEEDLDMATRVGAMEVVMTTMEEVTYWLEMTISVVNKYKSLETGGVREGCWVKMLSEEALVFQTV